jgi:hypothetical protein
MNKMILRIGFVICLIGTSVIIVNELSKPSVKGVSTTISPSPTITSSPTLSLTLTPTQTPTIKPVSTQTQPTSQAKQYGGWYWHPELNKSQVFIGTDSAGKDIWIDDFPAPTLTPTPKPATQQSFTQGTVSNASGLSSGGNMIQTKQTKIIEKK